MFKRILVALKFGSAGRPSGSMRIWLSWDAINNWKKCASVD